MTTIWPGTLQASIRKSYFYKSDLFYLNDIVINTFCLALHRLLKEVFFYKSDFFTYMTQYLHGTVINIHSKGGLKTQRDVPTCHGIRGYQC